MGYKDMLNRYEQRRALEHFLAFATSPTNGHCNYGAMLFLSSPSDVCFLAPIAPKARGIEIVCAESNRTFDIWKRPCSPKESLRLIASGLSAADVMLKIYEYTTYPEAEYLKHGSEWAEDTLRFYGVQKTTDT